MHGKDIIVVYLHMVRQEVANHTVWWDMAITKG